MDFVYLLNEIKENIGGQFVTDETLKEWAVKLKNAVFEDDDIEMAANGVVNGIIKEGKYANFRAGRGFNEIHNKILLARYTNLLYFFIDSLEITNGDEVFECCWNEIHGTNEQLQQGTAKKTSEASKKATERERKYFARAIEARLMQKSGDGYKWLHNNGLKASLGYFLNRVFNPKGTAQIPYQRMENLFNVSRLDTAIDQALTAKKPQKWRKEIDTLFDD